MHISRKRIQWISSISTSSTVDRSQFLISIAPLSSPPSDLHHQHYQHLIASWDIKQSGWESQQTMKNSVGEKMKYVDAVYIVLSIWLVFLEFEHEIIQNTHTIINIISRIEDGSGWLLNYKREYIYYIYENHAINTQFPFPFFQPPSPPKHRARFQNRTKRLHIYNANMRSYCSYVCGLRQSYSV